MKKSIVIIVLIGVLIICLSLLTNNKDTLEPDNTQPDETPRTTEDPSIDPEYAELIDAKYDTIHTTNIVPNQTITSPVVIKGEARGPWFFEGDFPITIVNWDGLIIGQGYASAQGEWMTTDRVPFEGTIEFETPQTYNHGWIILQKDNPSGLPEHDDALEIPVTFEI